MASSGSGYSIGGLVSGMDTSAIIDKLVAAQSRGLTPLNTQKKSLSDQLTALQSVTAKTIAFQVQAHRLATATNFNVTAATSSLPDAVAVTASADAVSGTYAMQVTSLARGEQKMSQGYDDPSSSIGTGTVTIGLGNATFGAITIDSSNNTLQGLADAINKADTAVHATIVNDGGSSANYHLVLTSAQTGASNTISFSSTLSGTAPSFTVLQAAKDAEIKIGDSATALTVKSASNTFDNVIPGVTLNLLNETASPVTIQVSADSDGVKSMVSDFITAYNAMVDQIGTATAYNAETKTAAPLMSDASVFVLRQQMVSLATTTRAAANTGDLRSLADLGITLDGGGHLTVSDRTALNNAVKNNLSGVRDLFSNSSTGLAKRLDDTLTTFTQATSGTLDRQQALIRTQTTLIDESITKQQASLAQYRTSLELEFSAMETAMAKFQAQSQYLTAYTSAQLASSGNK